MAYTIYEIENGQTGLVVREGINENFAQLFGNGFPIQLEDQSTSTFIEIPANTFVATLSFNPTSGTPIISIGTTEGGTDILPMSPIAAFSQIQLQQYFEADTLIYITWYNDATANVRIDLNLNYF